MPTETPAMGDAGLSSVRLDSPTEAAPRLADATKANVVERNSIILVLTDDQDQVLGAGFAPDALDAPTPMARTRELLARQGLTALHHFAHSPICCPSRAQLLTGRC